jgi:hypothetical protein
MGHQSTDVITGECLGAHAQLFVASQQADRPLGPTSCVWSHPHDANIGSMLCQFNSIGPSIAT